MRYRKIIGRAAAFLSAAALIGAGPETAAFAGQRKEAAVGENWQESGESQAVPYAGRNYEGIDLARLEQLLAQLEQACQGQEAMAADWRQAAVETAQGQEISGDPLSIYQQVLRELDWDATQMALADILYSRNMEDAALSAQYEEAAGKTQEAMEMVLVRFQRILGMPGGAALEAEMGPELARAVKDYEPASERLTQLWDQELELMLRYNQVYAEDFTVDVDGRQWNYASLDEAGLDYEDYYRIYMELEKENNRRLGEVYLELAQVRSQIHIDLSQDFSHQQRVVFHGMIRHKKTVFSYHLPGQNIHPTLRIKLLDLMRKPGGNLIDIYGVYVRTLHRFPEECVHDDQIVLHISQPVRRPKLQPAPRPAQECLCPVSLPFCHSLDQAVLHFIPLCKNLHDLLRFPGFFPLISACFRLKFK